MTTEREFLTHVGWDSASREDFPADWSTRHFTRLTQDGQTAILMQSVPDSDPRALAGHKIKDFIELSAALRGIDVHTPNVLADDRDNGFLLVEDLGSFSLHDAFEANSGKLEQYFLDATDVLIKLYDRSSRLVLPNTPNYFESHIFVGRRRLWDWYLPTVLRQKIDLRVIDQSLSILHDIENKMAPMKPVFLHGDFHPHNLMILSSGEIGVLDFQGGMMGPAPYDLVNLLRDARRFVPTNIRTSCFERFQSALNISEWESYETHYVMRSFDFHARVIGQAIKLALAGKPKLLSFIPILETYLAEDLAHPLLEPLQKYLQTELGAWPSFTPQLIDNVQDFISSDAF